MRYASVYAREGRPHFFVIYWCPRRKKRVSEVTTFKITDPTGRRRALAWANEKSKEASADKEIGPAERWETWARPFLEARYAGREKTLKRMLYAWDQWIAYLDEKQIRVPRALDYNGVIDFVTWRSSQIKPSSGKRVSKNTALCDVRVMSVVMREAMRRGYAEVNHAQKLGIEKDPAKQKKEILSTEVMLIRAELAKREGTLPILNRWMTICFEIALHQGCRLTETSLPLTDIDVDRGTITFRAKGRDGQPHIFTTKLHPDLVPLVLKLKEASAKVARKSSEAALTCVLPQMAAKDWHMFFKEIDLPHLSFHCTRVTVVTKMARGGVPIQQAMAYVGHSSEVVHKIYQKLAAQDLSRATAALQF